MTPTLRKAAILIAALDRKNADRLLNQLSPREAQALRQAVLRLDAVAADEQADVIEEFFEIGPWTQAAPITTGAGVELDPALAARLSVHPTSPADATGQLPRRKARVAVSSTLRCLQEIDSETLVPLLRKEHPQTIAVVISHLAHHQAARVLATLPVDIQSEVLRRVSDLEEMDPEILRELEHALESWLARHVSPAPQRGSAAGLAAVSDILRAADSGSQASLLANLHAHDQRLARQLAGEVPTPPTPSSPRLSFEQLAQLEDEALRTLLREAEPDLVMLALTGASKRILDRVLSLFPPRDAEVLRRELAHLGPMRLSDVEAARHELAVVAGRLADDNRIELRRKRLSVAA